MASAIRGFVEERGIEFLCHFTRLSNLPSILQHGLLTREECARTGIDPAINDPYRYDGTGAISVTISFPNYKMFYRLRCGNPGVEWVVINLKRSLLWRTSCAFSSTNAGDGTVYSVPIESRQGLVALESMFLDYGGIERAKLNIPDRYATNPQAEVLLLDGATVGDILGVYFERSATHQEYRAKYDGLPCHLNGGFFDARSDYAHWK